MTERISIEREGAVFRIDIDMQMEQAKAAGIMGLVEQDAGKATVILGQKRRLRRVEARGLVSPMTMRGILNVLAA